MEWWHIGPLVLAVLVFLLVGTVIERQVETAVFSIINRQPPASQATVGVETSSHRQQEPQQQQSQQEQLQKQQSQQQQLQKQQSQQLQPNQTLQQQLPQKHQSLDKQSQQHQSLEKQLQQHQSLEKQTQQQEFHHQQLQQHNMLQKQPLDDTLPPLPAVSEKSVLHPTSKTTIVSRVADLSSESQAKQLTSNPRNPM